MAQCRAVRWINLHAFGGRVSELLPRLQENSDRGAVPDADPVHGAGVFLAATALVLFFLLYFVFQDGETTLPAHRPALLSRNGYYISHSILMYMLGKGAICHLLVSVRASYCCFAPKTI